MKNKLVSLIALSSLVVASASLAITPARKMVTLHVVQAQSISADPMEIGDAEGLIEPTLYPGDNIAVPASDLKTYALSIGYGHDEEAVASCKVEGDLTHVTAAALYITKIDDQQVECVIKSV